MSGWRVSAKSWAGPAHEEVSLRSVAAHPVTNSAVVIEWHTLLLSVVLFSADGCVVWCSGACRVHG
jgi:hypothetical protein